MKNMIIIFLVLTLFIPLVACNEQNDRLGTDMPTAEPSDGIYINEDIIFDETTNFSYITYKAGYKTRPYFEHNAMFPENIFIYETNTPSIDDIKLYGYMNENFEKLSGPISLSPNVFTMGVAMIDGEEGSYIVNSDFENMVELCNGYALVDNGIVKVSWESKPPDHVTVLTITNPDSYLVPVKVDTSLFSDKGKVFIYGYKTVTEFLSGDTSDDDLFVIPPVFEDARPFFNGLAAVKSDGLWGYIDESGNTIIDFIYHEAGDFIETSTFVFQGKMRTYYYGGTPPRQEDVLEGYWALIDTEGNPLTPFEIRYADGFYDGWAIVHYAVFEKIISTGGTYDTGRTLRNYINTNGENFWKGSISSVLEPFINGIALINVGVSIQFYDANGMRLFKKEFRFARNFSDGLAAARTGSGSRSWTYIDSSGMTVFDERFLSAGDFSNGYAFVVKEFMKPGFIIDKLGKRYLEELNIYGMTKFNDEGYALAYTIVDKNETTQERLYYMIHIENLP